MPKWTPSYIPSSWDAKQCGMVRGRATKVSLDGKQEKAAARRRPLRLRHKATSCEVVRAETRNAPKGSRTPWGFAAKP